VLTDRLIDFNIRQYALIFPPA